MPILRGFAEGDWKAQCFRCGGSYLASMLRKEWQGYYVCQRCWEPRHPQDFVKGVPDDPSVPWTQPDNWAYVGPNYCTPDGKTAIPGLATPNCSIPNQVEGGTPR